MQLGLQLFLSFVIKSLLRARYAAASKRNRNSGVLLMSEDIKQQWVWNPLNSLSPITVQTPQNHSEIPWPTTHAEQQTYGVSQQCDTIKILLYCSLDYLILANSYITPISLYQFLQHFNYPLFSYYLGVPSSLLS